MATMSSTKKTILSVFKSMPLYASPRLSTASFSTAYERAEGANAVAEANSDDGSVFEGKQQDLATTNDAAKDGPIKAVEGSDMVRDTAKDSMDGAWKASQETSHKVREDGENDSAGKWELRSKA